MLDFDASKLLIIGMVALVVIGPKDLPRVLRQVGQMVGKLRRMAGEFQGQFMEAMKEADFQDLKAEVAKLKDSATLDVDFNPVRDVSTELNSAMAAVSTPVASTPVASMTSNPGLMLDLPAPDAAPNLVAAGIAPVVEDHAVEPELPVSTSGFATPDAANLPELAAAVVEPEASLGATVPQATRRRKITVPKRRAPGDRLAVTQMRPTLAWRSRSYCPPRREVPTS